MTGHEHRDVVSGVQALRREVERDNCLDGAFGMAAWPWPHQVAQVKAILEDTCVRHCIADEVGLGKTVQAVAVVRALMLRRPNLRVAFFVPDELVAQWRDEALARGGFAVDDPGEPTDDTAAREHRPMLVWPARVRTQPDLWAGLQKLDVLVVDELTRLSQSNLERLVRIGRDVPNLLVLTATPPLNDDSASRRLLEMVEPVRALLGGEQPWQHLLHIERTAAEGADVEARRRLAPVYAAARRIVRARRSSWRGVLPSREVVLHEIEPTVAELERERLLWRWMRRATDTSRDFDHVRLAQRVRSRRSLVQRVTYLRGHGHDREDLLERISALLGAEHGDSRYEGLCDVLCTIWREDPQAKVLVGANDNLTVDDLAERLPASFDDHGGAPLSVAKIRNQRAGPGALVDPDDQVQAAVAAFRTGTAKVLLLTDEGVTGLNLQYARHVVLFALPWDPVEVEQLLGRVDRLGNEEATAKGEEQGRPIVVHVLVQRGTVDERVCEVFIGSGLLKAPLATDRADVKALGDHIARVGLAAQGDEWRELVVEARRVASQDEEEQEHMPLYPYLPAAAPQAGPTARHVLDAMPAWPTLIECDRGERGRSTALRAWLVAMSSAGEYKFTGSVGGTGIEKFSYHHSGSRAREASVVCRRPVPSLPAAWSSQWVRTHRRGTEIAPTFRYPRRDGTLARVTFLDHGADLHEELVSAWRLRTSSGATRVQYSLVAERDGPLFTLRGSTLTLVIGRVDPGVLLPSSEEGDSATDADLRFLRGRVRSEVVVEGVITRGSAAPVRVARRALEVILGRCDAGDLKVPRSSEWGMMGSLGAKELSNAVRAALDAARAAARDRVTSQVPGLLADTDVRIQVIKAEAADLAALAEGAVRAAGASANGSAHRATARCDALSAAAQRAVEGDLFVLSAEVHIRIV